MSSSSNNPLPARDFWLTIPKNYESQAGKYIQLYITSPKATSVHVQVVGGSPNVRSIAAQEVFAFTVPLAWEMTTSGIIENKGIHIWSDDADLVVHALLRNPATSDGMNIISTSGWGTDYVVAAYHSLYEGFGQTFDYPSEFAIVAAHDSTTIVITPTVDIRKNGLKNDVLHKKGDTFSVVLHRGQSVQYMATEAQNSDSYDVTGTTIISTKPVGVFGASQCPNIPPEYPYCNFICEMITPITAWGRTYHTVPFYNRKGGDSFLMIGTKDGQTIYLNGIPKTTLMKFEHYFRPDIAEAGKWTSDAPFFLAQYINSTEWPDPVTGQTNNGIGDPSMVVINPLEQYETQVVFQAPTITSGTGFTNYANVIVRTNAVASTTLDGIPIASYPSTAKQTFPDATYSTYVVRSLKAGTHVVRSSEPAGVYQFGYGSYDAYSWNGSLGTKMLNSIDTTAPQATASGDCFCSRVHVTDVFPGMTGISHIVVDTSYNIDFTHDPALIPGAALDTSFYDICIVQPSDVGYIKVSIYDHAGNRRVVTSRIEKRTAPEFIPTSLEIAYTGPSFPNHGLFVLKNTTTAPLVLTGADGLRFLDGLQGFSLLGPDLSDLAAGVTRTFQIRYIASDSLIRFDTLVIGAECNMAKLAVSSFNGGPVLPLEALYDYGCIPLGTQSDTLVMLFNTLAPRITVDSIKIDDQLNFTVIDTVLPLVLASGGFYNVPVKYHPTTVDTHETQLHIYTDEFGKWSTNIRGCVIPAGSVRDGNISLSEDDLHDALRNGREFAWLAPTPNPSDRSSTIRFTFGLVRRASVGLESFDLLGRRVDAIAERFYDAGIHTISLSTDLLQSGSLIYRYSVNGKPFSGMFTIR